MDNQINFSQNHGNKETGSTLEALEWNLIMGELDTVIALIPTGGDGSGSGTGTQSVADTHISKSAKGNVEFVTTQADLNTEGKGGKINIESYSDILIKPGDDIIFTSSHRPVKNMDEVSVKIHDGEDHPVKLQVNTADIVLTTKDKGSTKTKNDDGSDTTTAMYDDPAVLNVTVNSAKDTRGYLKVRAQAIDLRSESHGGIALQPKGNDGQGHENKIKFEHGGGDGLEFGTFNTQKTSIFTKEYRFNKNGVWKMATRRTETSDKADASDSTTALKYVKQFDDFYDIVDQNDAQATTEDIIRAGKIIKNIGFNDNGDILTSTKNCTVTQVEWYDDIDDDTDFSVSKESSSNLPSSGEHSSDDASKIIANIKNALGDSNKNFETGSVEAFEDYVANNQEFMILYENIDESPNLKAAFKIKTSDGESTTTPISDIVKLVNYMKDNNQGPWANSNN